MVQATQDMTLIEVPEDYPTIQNIRKIFKNHGFDVYQSHAAGTKCDRDGTVFLDWHIITFRGDYPDEGLRAFDVAVSHGLVPATPLRLEWSCHVHRRTGEGTIDNEPTWVMEFQTADCKGTHRNIRCSCFS